MALCWHSMQALQQELFHLGRGEKGRIMVRSVFIFSVALGVLNVAWAQGVALTHPPNFPAVTAQIYDASAVGEGYVYMAVADEVEGVGFYLMILDNDGAPVWHKELAEQCAYDFKMQPNGTLSYAQLLERRSYAGGGDAVHMVMDKDFVEIDSFQMGNGYLADARDFCWLANGHALLFGCSPTEADLSDAVAGGWPDALVSGAVVQELDADRNVVFQWRTCDHLDVESSRWEAEAAGPAVGAFHLNAVNMDADGHLLLATDRWVKKISRRTGEILWHLGGEDNEFTFVGVDADQAARHFSGYAFHRLDNGHVLIYNSGEREAARSSQVHEYALDEENRIAEHVWSYVPDPPVFAGQYGNAQRLSNGNTFIGWGSDGSDAGPACTEVTSDGRKVFELSFDDPRVESYRAFRLPLPADIAGAAVTKQYVGIGDSEFKRAATDTGVTLRINSYTGTGYNVMGVVRTPLAPLYPTFEEPAPIVMPVRVQVGANGINTINAQICFDVASFAVSDPERCIVYRRNPKAAEPFVALPTSYDAAAGKLRADMGDFGEFIITTPDVELMPPVP